MSHPILMLPAAAAAAGLLLAVWYALDSAPPVSPPAAVAQEAQRPNAARRRARQQQQRAQIEASTPPPQLADVNASVLSFGDSYDDFASAAQAPDGALYAAYAAYFDGHDQIRLHKRLPGGDWSTRTHVPLVNARADIWMPQLAVDAANRLWVIWCEQSPATEGAEKNWDLYARSLDGETWGEIVRLTDDPKPDINPHVSVDTAHNIYVVWQAHPENTGDIQLCRFDGKQWSKPLAVTSGSASDWFPQASVDAEGAVWIAFDSYRNGDYDVFLVRVKGDQVGEPIPIAASKYYEAHPSVACAPDGRVWIAWETGGYYWGKDQGHWLNLDGKNVGSALGSTRHVRVAAWQDGKLSAAPPLTAALPPREPPVTSMPGLTVDADGRVWLRFRRQQRGVRGRGNRVTRYWTENVTHLTREGWKPAQMLAASEGRISVFSRLIPLSQGGVLAAYSGDQRSPANYHQPVHDRALAQFVDRPDEPAGSPDLEAYEPPAPPQGAGEFDLERERKQVAAIRAHRAEIDGQSMRIVRGDLHRHSELSWDVGPGNDGSFLDFYRYMIDAAAMDFGGLTDHQGGGQYAYHWWLIEKSADLYFLPPRFVPLYGYERSAKFPDGHRNVFHSYRGVPVFPFQLRLDQTGVFPGVGSGALATNDTKLLYEYLHRSRGISIPHTSGTDTMGTDWRDNDPEIEPVVEIYQGARNSYEVVGGPRVHDVTKSPPGKAPGGYQEAGMVWNALAKGYRLGMTSSSDHGSTHISYSMVYTPENDRQSIIDSICRRHTYGATDNLIVEARANKRFMGEEFNSPERPSLELRVTGTAPIARIDLVRNNAYIYTTSPLKIKAEVNYVDMEPKEGLNYYYFRVLQDDGQVAWASPVWVNYESARN